MTLSHNRRARRDIPIDLVGEDHNVIAPDIVSEVIDGQDALRMIQKLPPTQRHIMALHYEGFQPVEISEMLGITFATVRPWLAFGPVERDELEMPSLARRSIGIAFPTGLCHGHVHNSSSVTPDFRNPPIGLAHAEASDPIGSAEGGTMPGRVYNVGTKPPSQRMIMPVT